MTSEDIVIIEVVAAEHDFIKAFLCSIFLFLCWYMNFLLGEFLEFMREIIPNTVPMSSPETICDM